MERTITPKTARALTSKSLPEIQHKHQGRCLIDWGGKEGEEREETQCQLQNVLLCMCAHLVNAWLVKEKPLPVQVAVSHGSLASHVCTFVNALDSTRKTPPVQVAGDAHCKCK